MPLLWKFELHQYLIFQWTRAQLAIDRDWTHNRGSECKRLISPFDLLVIVILDTRA